MGEGRPCKKCRAKLEFQESESGAKIPAQRVKTLYVLRKGKLVAIPLDGPWFINHYETCPDAESFSKKKDS